MINMKLIDVLNFLPVGTWVRIWTEDNDENDPDYEGYIEDAPMYLANRELVKGEEGTYFELRYEACGYSFKDGVKEHVALFLGED
jgi:hypothetical protein